MTDDTLTGHLLELSRSLDEYRAAVKKQQSHFSFEVEKLWDDQAELRDDLHAVANRLEALTRSLTTEPAEVAERMLRDAD